MTESKEGAGGLIMAAIVIGAVWVGFGMFRQNGFDGPSLPPMPKLPDYKSQYTGKNSASSLVKENPYVADLLAPRSAAKPGECARFLRFLHDYLGPQAAAAASTDDTAGSAKRDPGLSQLLGEAESDYERGETAAGLEKIKTAGDRSSGNSLPERSRIDLAWCAARLNYKGRDFDSSRAQVGEALQLSRQNQDYKIEELEGLRSLLGGGSAAAASYEADLAKFNESMARADYKKLPGLARTLISDTATLPADNYFRLQAMLNMAAAQVMAGGDAEAARISIKEAEAEAEKANDRQIMAECHALIAKLEKR